VFGSVYFGSAFFGEAYLPAGSFGIIPKVPQGDTSNLIALEQGTATTMFSKTEGSVATKYPAILNAQIEPIISSLDNGQSASVISSLTKGRIID
jgi:hypothetical protein